MTKTLQAELVVSMSATSARAASRRCMTSMPITQDLNDAGETRIIVVSAHCFSQLQVCIMSGSPRHSTLSVSGLLTDLQSAEHCAVHAE